MRGRVDRGGEHPGPGSPPHAFDDLYRDQWWPMLRLATGLVDTVGAAEDVVQDAFTAVYRQWDEIREPAAAPVVGDLIYLATNGRQVTQLCRE